MARHYRRLIFWLLAGIATLLLLAAAALAALWWFIDPDDYRQQIQARASAAIGRQVHLTGKLRWQPGLRVFIASDGGELANAAGFGPEPLLRWSRLQLGVALWPLLHKRILIDRIDIDGLVLQLERNAQGLGNWQFQLPAVPDDKESTVSLRIAEVNLSNGDIRYRDSRTNADWQLHELSFGVRLPEDLAAPDREFRAIGFAARVAGGPLAQEGVRVSLKAESLRMSPEQLQVSAIDGQWAGATFSGAATVRTASEPDVTANFRLQAPSLRALLATAGVTPSPMSDPATLGRLQLDTALRYAEGAATFNELSISLDDTRLTGTLSLPRLEPPALRFDLTADRVNLDRYMEPAVTPGEPFELPLADLKALDAKGVLRIQQATVAGAAAKEVRIDVE